MTPAEMRKQKYIPSCVNKYYSQEIAKLVYNYYYEDFKKYGYSEDSYKWNNFLKIGATTY